MMLNMPMEVAVTCDSNQFWEKEVQGSTDVYMVTYQKLYDSEAPTEYGWTCTCQGYKFKRHCKHIEQVKNDRCGWNAELDVLKATKFGRCPKCRGEVKFVRVAI